MGISNDLQQMELTILTAFSTVCAREGLTWYAMFGTLLGAVRHEGFIPWDDDIDVAMPRADYDRLRRSPGLFQEPYFLQTPQNDPQAAAHFLRLRRSDTTVLTGFPNGLTRGGHLGVYIDILPLDTVTDAKAARKAHDTALWLQRQLLASAALDEYGGDGEDMPREHRLFCYANGGMAGQYALLAERYEQVCAACSKGAYYAISVVQGIRGGRIYDKTWFEGNATLPFEGLPVHVPTAWREVLNTAYPRGLDEPAAARRRKPKHAIGAVDTGRSYRDYLPRFADTLKVIEGKRVALFGAGNVLRVLMSRYGNRFEAVCAADNARAKWGTKVGDVPVVPPSDLPARLEADAEMRMVIASCWHVEIAAQLEAMGIRDYHVFADGWNYDSHMRTCIYSL